MITSVKELAIQDITGADRVEHESVGDASETCTTYADYYHRHIAPNTKTKIILFELVKSYRLTYQLTFLYHVTVLHHLTIDLQSID